MDRRQPPPQMCCNRNLHSRSMRRRFKADERRCLPCGHPNREGGCWCSWRERCTGRPCAVREGVTPVCPWHTTSSRFFAQSQIRTVLSTDDETMRVPSWENSACVTPAAGALPGCTALQAEGGLNFSKELSRSRVHMQAIYSVWQCHRGLFWLQSALCMGNVSEACPNWKKHFKYKIKAPLCAESA
jgi:hypothetical protein